MSVPEGSNVTLQCAADGYPAPNITWRREDNKPIIGLSMTDSPTIQTAEILHYFVDLICFFLQFYVDVL